MPIEANQKTLTDLKNCFLKAAPFIQTILAIRSGVSGTLLQSAIDIANTEYSTSFSPEIFKSEQ